MIYTLPVSAPEDTPGRRAGKAPEYNEVRTITEGKKEY
jgi:hypothetical protein